MRAGRAENSKRLRGRKTFHEKFKKIKKFKSLNYYGYKNGITLYVLDTIIIINIIIIIIVKSKLF